ncbi:MAG: ECF transporter S component [Armatimonadota bacterium]
MRYSAKDLAIGGLFGALGVVLPIIFHLVGLGKTFLPMHLPVLVCGFLVSPAVAFSVGFVTPLASSVLTGMPPLVPTALLMTLELAALALTASLCYQKLRLPTTISVLVAIFAARVVGGLELFALAPLIGFNPNLTLYLTQSVIFSLPGIIMQIIAAPLAVAAINRITRSHSIYTREETS